MGERGVLGTVSAVGFHGFPGTWDSETGTWLGYATHLAVMRAVLAGIIPMRRSGSPKQDTRLGGNDEAVQVDRFRQTCSPRPPDDTTGTAGRTSRVTSRCRRGLYFDPRHYHLGYRRAGRPKILRRQLEAPGVGGATATGPRLHGTNGLGARRRVRCLDLWRRWLYRVQPRR